MIGNPTTSDLIEKKEYRTLKLFVDLGFEISLTENNGDNLEKFGNAENIIYDSIISDDLELIKKQPKYLLNAENKKGYTPLHWAIIAQRNSITDYILCNSLNHAIETETRENAFSLAARYDNEYAFSRLIKVIKKPLIYNKNERGFNSLLFACARKNLGIIKECINHSTEQDLRALNMYGANFLHWLVHGKDVSDEIKKNMMNSVLKLIDKKIEKKDIKIMLQEKNAIDYSPLSWLEHYHNHRTYKLVQDI